MYLVLCKHQFFCCLELLYRLSERFCTDMIHIRTKSLRETLSTYVLYVGVIINKACFTYDTTEILNYKIIILYQLRLVSLIQFLVLFALPTNNQCKYLYN